MEIDELYVVPDRRSEGVGRLLVDEILKAATGRGVRRFHAFSSSTDIRRGTAFYEELGFEPWGVQLFREIAEP